MTTACMTKEMKISRDEGQTELGKFRVQQHGMTTA